MSMNSKLNLLLFLLAIFGVAVFSQKLNAGNIIPDKTLIVSGSVFSIVHNWNLSEKLEVGKKLFEKRYWRNITEIIKASELRKKYLDNPEKPPRLQSENSDEEFIAVSNWWNSFNSDISVARKGTVSGRYVVVVNKYLMANDDLVYPEERTGAKYSD